jgi:broad specificity phosphatase PhoE
VIRAPGAKAIAGATLAIAIAATAFCAGSAAAGLTAAADSSSAVPNSAAAPARGSTATAADSASADSLRAARKEFPHPDSTLVPRLRSGGYVIVFRHSTTDMSQRDVDGEHFDDRSAQRNLNKEGEAQAARIGKAIAELHLPIGAVLSSPMWRCRDTAQIAFGRHEATPDLFRRGPEYRAIRLKLLGTAPAEAKDLVLVTHQDLLLPIVEGLRRDQLKEGDALVVRPLGAERFEIVAQVTPDDWDRLAASKTAAVAKDGKTTKTSKSTKPKKTTSN